MCGIVGGLWSVPPNNLERLAEQALAKLSHRGPNGQEFKFFQEKNKTIGLGHTRLSVIDTSMGGHQPMISSCGRYVIIFNGEIYNYKELRKKLETEGMVFVSDSDTEVLLAAWIQWHVKSLSMFEGMFSFVVYDNVKNTLSCVRDAFGIKPFFYTQDDGNFIFASEQPALLILRNKRSKVDWQRSYDYLVHGDYDSQENTFIEGIKHLMPGHWLEVSLNNGNTRSVPLCWWKPTIAQSSDLSFDQAAEAVREQFLHNIRLHLRSDVPLGAALSGGVDSSAVVCAIRYVEPDLPIKTFSFIAESPQLNEEKWVDYVNQHTNAQAHKISISDKDLISDLNQMIVAQGEPFGSTSIYAQYRVFQHAREHGVVVTLDGQGADELLAGYNGYPGYRLLSLLEGFNPIQANKFARNWGTWPGRSYKQAWMYLADIKLSDGLYKQARKSLGGNFSPHWLKNNLMHEKGVRFSRQRSVLLPENKGRRVIEQLASSLQNRGLPALLRHGDRNAMQFSVESRVPFLTSNMAHLLFSLPEEYLISQKGETKSIFRAAMRGIVPDEILDRKDKIGFATPEEKWLISMSSTIREWLQTSDQIPFLDHLQLLKSFDEIVSGKAMFSWQVWRWVNFVKWYENLEMTSE